jgi:hypothetical protein
MSYQQKYLKYKKKYIFLKNMHGGTINSLSQIELAKTDRTYDELLNYAKTYYPLVSEQDTISRIENIIHHNQSNVSFNNLINAFEAFMPHDPLPPSTQLQPSLPQTKLAKTGRTDDELLNYAKVYYPLVNEQDAMAKIANIRHHNIPSHVSFNSLINYFEGFVSRDRSTQSLPVPPSPPALSVWDLAEGYRSESRLVDYANMIFPAMDHSTKIQVIHEYMERNRETLGNISYNGLRMNLRFKNS